MDDKILTDLSVAIDPGIAKEFNLLSAKLNHNQAKYSAKIAELALKRLSGTLLEATF